MESKLLRNAISRELQGKQMLYLRAELDPLHVWNPAAHCVTGHDPFAAYRIYGTLHLYCGEAQQADAGLEAS